MRFTRSVSYAVGVLLRVAADGAEGPVTAAAIAKGCRFPPRFLYRVLRRLVDADLLTGVSGPHGGYALSRAPGKINLLEIVAAAEGESSSDELIAVHRSHKPAIALLNKLAVEQQQAFERRMKRVTLSKLAATVRKPRRKK